MDKFSAILNEDDATAAAVKQHVLYEEKHVIDINDERTLILDDNGAYIKTLTMDKIIKSQNLEREKINETIIKLFRQFATKAKAKYAICNSLDYTTFRYVDGRTDHFDYNGYAHHEFMDVEISIMGTQYMYFFKSKEAFDKMIKMITSKIWSEI